MGKKISELEARTAVTNNDIFVIVDEPGTGSAETAKITYSTLRDSIIAEAGFNTVGNDQILDPASAGGNVTINADATVNGDFTVYGNTIIHTGSQIVSNPDNPITINPGGTGDTIIESELITNGPITANNNLSVNGDFSVTGNVDGIGLLDLDNANTSKIADGTAGFLLQTDGAGNFSFVQGASTKGTFTDGAGVTFDDQNYNITGITQANPGVMTVEAGHNLVTGDSITVTGVNGMTEVNDQTYFVSVSGNDLTLYSDSAMSTQVNTTGFSAYIDSGVADSGDGAFVPGSPVGSINDLSDVDTATNAPSAGDALKWDGTNFVPVASAEIDPNMTPTDGQALVWDDQQYALSGATQANPVVITLPTDHNLSNGDAITITGVGGMTELNDQTVYVSVGTNGEVSLYSDAGLTTPIDGSSYSAYTSGGTASAGTGNWVANAAASSVGTLTDVDTTGLADGQILKYNSANSTWTPMSTGDLLEADDSVPTITDRGQAVTNATFSDGDVVMWDAQGYNISNIIKSNSTVQFTSMDVPGHNYSNGDLITITGVQGMTELNNNQYYVQVLVQNGVAIYTDEALTQHVNSQSFGTYVSSTGFAQGSGTWTAAQIGATTQLGDLIDVDLSTVTNDRRFLAYNVSSQNWVPASGAEIAGNGGQPGMTGGNIYIDPDNITNGQTLTWIDHEFDIVDISEANNQLYVDFGSTAHAKDQIGTASWVVFDMSGAVGATELDYQTGVWHFLTQVNADPSVNSHYAVTTGNIFSSDTLTQYLGPNTSAWTSGGKIIKVNGNGANSVGGFIATASHTHEDANTGGVPITSPESGLSAGDQLTWSDGTVGRGQIGGITNTGTQPTYVTDSDPGHEVEFSRPGTPVVMPSPDPADYWTPGSTLAEIDATGYDRVVGRFLDLHESGGANHSLNNVYLELTTATSTVANSDPDGTGKRRYHMIKLDQSTRARLTHANGEYQVYTAPTGSQDITSTTIHDADARFERVDPATGQALGSWVALSSSSSSGAAVLNISDTPPSSPDDGALWWESDTGRLKLYYNDGSSAQWVDAFTTSTAADKNIFNQTTQEKTNVVTNAGSGGKDYDCSSAGIHHLSNIAGDIDANLTNLSLDVGYSTTVTFVLNQTSSAKVVKTLSIGGSSQTVKWVGGVVPTGTASGVDAMSFSIIRTGASAYTVLGQLVPFS